MRTIIHIASGAIVGSSVREPVSLPDGFATIDGNYSSRDSWWDGSAMQPREEVALALSPNPVSVGEVVTITAPAGSHKRPPDGAIISEDSFICPAGHRAVTVSLMGRYRGEARIEIA
ncbi:hypothetical protein CLG96_00100 [Sphingomonas oleivorans]|uniref:Uncharacterized protein n=1 Tax=Sphingomonas oleivorans TaxID=1735121 RepID=A0A2T5G3C3_9SPHN|nr:hypothetical protein [Sphingomonas oleivorans]PTQ13722.1 hypothetical protein CLG96_00100 [Sphingomonas oleivorans]